MFLNALCRPPCSPHFLDLAWILVAETAVWRHRTTRAFSTPILTRECHAQRDRSCALIPFVRCRPVFLKHQAAVSSNANRRCTRARQTAVYGRIAAGQRSCLSRALWAISVNMCPLPPAILTPLCSIFDRSRGNILIMPEEEPGPIKRGLGLVGLRTPKVMAS